MKKTSLCVALTVIAGTVIWFSQGVSSQVTVAPGALKAAPSDVEKRLATLETENAQLKKDVAGLKIVLAGLDKGVTALKNSYDTHTHKLNAGTLKPMVNDPNVMVPWTNVDSYKTKGGLLTGGPVH